MPGCGGGLGLDASARVPTPDGLGPGLYAGCGPDPGGACPPGFLFPRISSFRRRRVLGSWPVVKLNSTK